MKHFRKLTVLATVAVLALTVLCSCGKAKTYKYSDLSVESSSDGVDAMMKPMLESMYKDSTLEIKSDTATLIIDDVKNEMSMKKDGDKYMLSGDYSDRYKEMFGNSGTGMEAEYKMYLLETEKGYDYIIEETIKIMKIDSTTIIKIHYVK